MASLPEYSDSDFSDDNLSPLDVAFNKAADHVRKLTNKLNNNQLLELYGLFKQGTEGACSTPKPGWFDNRGRRKWEAWKSLGEMPSDEAKQKYIDSVQKYDPGTDFQEKQSKENWVAVSSLRYSPEPDLVHNDMTLLDAAREDCEERVKELLAKNPELRHERDEDGLTALHWAADRDATKSLKAAIDGGCPIDTVDEYGQTALHYAASCGNIESAKILLQAGAAMLKDSEDCTPVDLASDEEIRKVLEGAK